MAVVVNFDVRCLIMLTIYILFVVDIGILLVRMWLRISKSSVVNFNVRMVSICGNYV